MYLFFFSSRRRHTRSKRDWSSDVCSSDLAAAYDLNKAGHQVTIFEGADRVGGLAAGFRDDNWDWELEKYYHHWFQSDHDILALIAELGLSDKVLFPRPKTSMWSKGKAYLF